MIPKADSCWVCGLKANKMRHLIGPSEVGCMRNGCSNFGMRNEHLWNAQAEVERLTRWLLYIRESDSSVVPGGFHEEMASRALKWEPAPRVCMKADECESTPGFTGCDPGPWCAGFKEEIRE